MKENLNPSTVLFPLKSNLGVQSHEMLLSLLKQKKTIWLVCGIPLLVLLCQAFFRDLENYKFWSHSLTLSGYTAVALLVLGLSLAPLAKHFPSSKLFSILSRHKREVGLSCFYYVLIHISSYYIKKILRRGAFNWDSLLHPVNLAGEAALLILIALALTSDDWWVRRLTWKRWKTLHRLVYLAEIAIFIHMALQGGTVLFWGLALFIPLAAVQLIRR
jgi:sulfoxide reductase heme-binding subunit YedZ